MLADFKHWIIFGFKTEVIVHMWSQVLRTELCQTSAPTFANSAKYKNCFQMSPEMNTRENHWQWQQPAKLQNSALHT